MEDKSLPFWGHVIELRRRLLLSAAALLVCSVAVFSFIEPAAKYIMAQAGNLSFVYLSPPELFMGYVRLALIAGAVLSSPLILFQLWLFVRPGLEKHERRNLFWSLVFGLIFFACGGAFSFFVIIPFCLRFFLQYQNEAVKALFSFNEYLSFVLTMVFSFGLAFELPVVSSLLASLGIITGTGMARVRGISVLLIFIVAAIITPPDVVSQVLLAVPMVILFELAVILAKGQEKRRAKLALENETELKTG
ncbi:twin-arginine translocase subunit TatC [Spirochaetota bacterium]